MEILVELKDLLFICLVCAFLVFIAMCMDLVSGVHKAKIRGEARTSYGLSRTINKFLLYEGSVVVGACVSVIASIAHFWTIIGVPTLNNVPVMCCIVSIFICFVELLSLKEKASEKQRKHIADTGKAIGAALEQDSLVKALVAAIKEISCDKEKV